MTPGIVSQAATPQFSKDFFASSKIFAKQANKTSGGSNSDRFDPPAFAENPGPPAGVIGVLS
jgi:hypothetical protein